MVQFPLPVLGSYFQYRDRSISGPVGAFQVLEANSNRWAILWFFTSGTAAVFPTEFGPGLSGGFRIDLGQGVLLHTFTQLGSMIQASWSGSTNPVGSVIGCYEVVYMPPASAQSPIQEEEF